ncbi:hypothetical protein EXIGLDRAFT_91149 [Exidia glandulosa HHB12029]|uniref:Uncharacterized protein n=1 Tax=Exidia glandulosa HHB12029 TaxID=1314781 RepID=A0A165HAS9_EXIGL|nr:hypothetical protein EXIGLDRAFT_91149 [Exidia glandulosa HHB12029]
MLLAASLIHEAVFKSVNPRLERHLERLSTRFRPRRRPRRSGGSVASYIPSTLSCSFVHGVVHSSCNSTHYLTCVVGSLGKFSFRPSVKICQQTWMPGNSSSRRGRVLVASTSGNDGHLAVATVHVGPCTLSGAQLRARQPLQRGDGLLLRKPVVVQS